MVEADFIDFRCPLCGKDISFPEKWIGTVQDCPMCSGSFVVPDSIKASPRIIPLPIKTERLLLRLLEYRDQVDLELLMSDEESLSYLDWNTFNEEQVKQFIEENRNIHLGRPGDDLSLAIEADDSKVIGLAWLGYVHNDGRQAWFNIMIDREHRRKGYGTEVACGLLRFGFLGINLHRVGVGCDRRNLAACRVCEKAGMRKEGEFLEDQWIKGQYTSTIYYGLLCREYVIALAGNCGE